LTCLAARTTLATDRTGIEGSKGKGDKQKEDVLFPGEQYDLFFIGHAAPEKGRLDTPK